MVAIPIPLLPVQYDFLTCTAKYQALITGLGYGKTWIGARKAIAYALKLKGRLGLAASNSYRQLEDVVIPALTEALQQMEVTYRWEAGKARFCLANGSTILCRSLDRTALEKVRGTEFAWAWLDEARDMSAKAFAVVQGRAGRQRGIQSTIFITTTPNGLNWIYDRFGPDRPNQTDYAIFRAKTTDNPTLPDDYAVSLEDSYDTRAVKQELLGEFVASSETLYHAWDRKVHIREAAAYKPSLPLIVALDFNVSPCVAALIQERRGTTVVVDEIWNDDGDGTVGVIDRFLAKYPNAVDVQVYGDPAGHARDTRSGTTDYEMWRERVTRRIRVPRKTYPIVDRINSVNGRLRSHTGKIRLLVSPICKHLVADFEQVLPHKDGSRRPRKEADTPHLTHISDALGYYIVHEHPLRARLDRLKAANKDAATLAAR